MPRGGLRFAGARLSFTTRFNQGLVGASGGFANPRAQGTRQGQGTLKPRIVPVQGFIQVDFHDPIVIEVHGFTEGVLSDFQSTVDIPS